MVVRRIDEVALLAFPTQSLAGCIVFEAVNELLRMVPYPEVFVHANQVFVIAFRESAHGNVNAIDHFLRFVLYRYGRRIE